jgi:type IV pilus assembly protein PilC
MVYYDYRAVNEAGRSVSGTVEAESTADALRILKEQGLREVYVGRMANRADTSLPEAAAPGASPGAPPATPSPPPSRRHALDWNELAELNGQLLGLVRAGLPLAPSIAAMARFMSGRRGRAVAKTLERDVASGLSLADALERQPAAFPPLCRAMMRAGEASGSVERVLSSLTDYSRAMAETRNRVVETITYPLVLVAAAFMLAMFMLIKVVPVFNDVLMNGFLEYGRPAALIFGAWVSLSDFAAGHLEAVFIAFFAVFAAIIWLCVPHPGGRLRFLWADAFRLHAPLFGKLNRMGAMSQFCRALGMLVEARTPLPEALELAGAASGNLVVEAAGRRAMEQVKAGGELGQSLIHAGHFDASLCWLAQNGENQHTLGETLQTLAGTYESNAERHRRWVLMALGPVTTIVIGLFVGLMFFSVYGPLIAGVMN